MSASTPKTLWIWSTLPRQEIRAEDQQWRRDGDCVENAGRIQMGGYSPGTFDVIRSGVHFPYTVQHTIELLGQLVLLGKPDAEVEICQVVVDNEDSGSKLKTSGQLSNLLKLAGFVNLSSPANVVIESDEARAEIHDALELSQDVSFIVVKVSCRLPNFEVGSSRKLSFADKIAAAKDPAPSKENIWNLDLDDDDVELVNQDDLLDKDDYIKPDPNSLRVCGTTGQRKACKDCSCGLREELEGEGKKDTPKSSATSSCGSCYLGDAFRCASCPYLGMPAFKPGEKIVLSERQLNPDK